MDYILADCAGSCYGVTRALDMTLKALQTSPHPIQTLGSLIHNPRVVESLSQMGIKAIDEPCQKNTGTLIIRSHGATPEQIMQAKDVGLHVIDATCPHVLAAQKAALNLAYEGCQLLIIGERNHPEVEGICAQAPNAVYAVVTCLDELPSKLPQKLGVVVQTTQSEERVEEIIQYLQDNVKDLVFKNTICKATSLRQRAAICLAQKVDCMLVIGGHNSANTRRLAELCSKICPTFHIENLSELKKLDLKRFSLVGITAGASTVESHIDEVKKYLDSLV